MEDSPVKRVRQRLAFVTCRSENQYLMATAFTKRTVEKSQTDAINVTMHPLL